MKALDHDSATDVPELTTDWICDYLFVLPSSVEQEATVCPKHDKQTARIRPAKPDVAKVRGEAKVMA